jgi:hypothetical protein
MARFKDDNLILTSAESLVVDGQTVIDNTRKGTFADITLDIGATINEFSIDGTLAGNSDTALPTEKAVKTYVGATIASTISAGNSSVEVTDVGTGQVAVTIDAVVEGTWAPDGLTLKAGAKVGEFSIDGTLAGNSDAAVPTEKAVVTYVGAQIQTAISSGTDERLARFNGTGAYVLQDSLVVVDDLGNMSGVKDLVLTGNLVVDGTTFVVNNQEVSTSDNLILINDGEVGPGVTGGTAGIEVDRGSAANYQFMFVEADDNFQVGEIGSLQAVATREDAPTTMRVPWWDAGNITFQTAGDTAITINTGTDTITFTGNSATMASIDPSGATFAVPLEVTSEVQTEGHFYAGNTDATASVRLNFDGHLYATKVFNAVWNDVADFQDVADEKIPGKCYFDTLSGAKICNEECQKAVIGILSDTYGFGLGQVNNAKKAPFVIAGWALACVDSEQTYETGDVLMNDSNGNLVKMSEEMKRLYPERIVATYKKPEAAKYFGPGAEAVKVNGRHWVKIR